MAKEDQNKEAGQVSTTQPSSQDGEKRELRGTARQNRREQPVGTKEAPNHKELLGQLQRLEPEQLRTLLCDRGLRLKELPETDRHFIAQAMDITHLYTWQRGASGRPTRYFLPVLPVQAEELRNSFSHFAQSVSSLQQLISRTGLELTGPQRALLDVQLGRVVEMSAAPLAGFVQAIRTVRTELGSFDEQRRALNAKRAEQRNGIQVQAQEYAQAFYQPVLPEPVKANISPQDEQSEMITGETE